jgi:hypothetical protein
LEPVTHPVNVRLHRFQIPDRPNRAEDAKEKNHCPEQADERPNRGSLPADWGIQHGALRHLRASDLYVPFPTESEASVKPTPSRSPDLVYCVGFIR